MALRARKVSGAFEKRAPGPIFPQCRREQPWLIRALLHGFISEKEAEYLEKILDRQ